MEVLKFLPGGGQKYSMKKDSLLSRIEFGIYGSVVEMLNHLPGDRQKYSMIRISPI